MNDQDFLKQLTRHEGSIPYAYQDSLGYWTIGVGVLIDKRKGGKLYPEEIEFILDNRVRKMASELVVAIPWLKQLDAVRRYVLLNMAFNLGIAGLLKFKNTLAMVQRGDYKGAAKGMLASLWAKQVKGRAVELAKMMETGNEPA